MHHSMKIVNVDIWFWRLKWITIASADRRNAIRSVEFAAIITELELPAVFVPGKCFTK